ncbi:MAG: hypothetical protein Q8N63_03790 [Nanoarchaeota archaeon]|nr:hypothetical protein [Nanoarchaeota archaeon]
MKKPVLSKIWAWIILIGLVVLDASLDLIFAEGKGLESGIWKPISDFLGIKNPLFMTPLVLVLFYLLVKGGAWLSKKVDKISVKTEELVLTTLVLVYGVFDLWLISVYFFNLRLFKSHLYLIPVLIVIGIAYNWWAENKLKKIKE